jgi:3-mercaptopyruvate sulfurtransferase SseA
MKKTKLFIPLFILILAASACNALTSSAAPEPLPTLAVVKATTSAPSGVPLTEDEVPRVSLEDAYQAYTDGSAIFVDVRSADSYNAGHIPSATNIQLGEFETNIDNIDLPKDAWIITYCT